MSKCDTGKTIFLQINSKFIAPINRNRKENLKQTVLYKVSSHHNSGFDKTQKILSTYRAALTTSPWQVFLHVAPPVRKGRTRQHEGWERGQCHICSSHLPSGPLGPRQIGIYILWDSLHVTLGRVQIPIQKGKHAGKCDQCEWSISSPKWITCRTFQPKLAEWSWVGQ